MSDILNKVAKFFIDMGTKGIIILIGGILLLLLIIVLVILFKGKKKDGSAESTVAPAPNVSTTPKSSPEEPIKIDDASKMEGLMTSEVTPVNNVIKQEPVPEMIEMPKVSTGTEMFEMPKVNTGTEMFEMPAQEQTKVAVNSNPLENNTVDAFSIPAVNQEAVNMPAPEVAPVNQAAPNNNGIETLNFEETTQVLDVDSVDKDILEETINLPKMTNDAINDNINVKKKCPYCGFENEYNSKKCAMCGREVI